MSELRNCQASALSGIDLLPVAEWREKIVAAVKAGSRLASLFGRPVDGRVRLLAILAADERGSLRALQTEVGDSYPALTTDCPQAHWFEREIAEQWSVVPGGHPWLKPIRFHGSYRPGLEQVPSPVVGVTSFFQVEGEEVHEVAVGPVHAGIIEPGHFRFQCHGERVIHLEISLGYQHRGVERALVGGPHPRTLFQMETLAGDTSIGHATAYCQAIEALAGCDIPPRAAALRGIALELERLANHTGDLGALAGDVGYLPTSSFCGRLRGDFLNMTAALCGSRFGRAMVKPGGVAFDVNAERIDDLLRRLAQAESDVKGAVDLLWRTPSVMGRFEYVGKVSRADALALGLVGPPARATGLELDVRRDHPVGIWRVAQVPVATMPYGDVFCRAYVRWLEIERSIAFVREQLRSLPASALRVEVGAIKGGQLVVSLVEGWRGEIAHAALTDAGGRFESYKVVDPSFHNWFGLALSLREQPISDFPLCNKSFNLSYCGHDL
jgi:Ni,Fe-hydrogenase III large subunit